MGKKIYFFIICLGALGLIIEPVLSNKTLEFPLKINILLTSPYIENFEGERGEQPWGWIDEDQNTACNAHITLTGSGTARVAKTPEKEDQEIEGDYGFIISKPISLNLSEFNTLVVNVNNIDNGSGFRIILQDFKLGQEIDLTPAKSFFEVKKYEFDIVAKTGWDKTTKTFSVKIVVEGPEGKILGTTFESIKIL